MNDSSTETENTETADVNQDSFIDIHCHCLHSIDDGPATDSQTLELCQALTEDRIETVIATPHQLGRYNDSNKAIHIRERVSALNENLKNNNIPLTVLAGGDVRVDERICQLLDDDEILTLADTGKYILLELPHEIFLDIEPLLIELAARGIQAIISHPERHHILATKNDVLNRWLKNSAGLQVTAASLLGKFGGKIQKIAWQFLRSGQARFVATDAHDLQNRRPCMTEAFEQITLQMGQNVARQLCIENPLRVLQGRDTLPIDNYEAALIHRSKAAR